MLLVLTCAAGLVDAISYLELGHVFTAMMTGNTVLLALALGQGEVTAALRSTLALVAFSAGVAGGVLVLLRGRGRGEWPPIVGIQAAAVRHLGVPGVASTYITGTLTSLMAELANGSASRHLRLLASVFLVYGAGALIGTVLQARSSALLAWLPFVCVGAVVVNGLVRHREPRL